MKTVASKREADGFAKLSLDQVQAAFHESIGPDPKKALALVNHMGATAKLAGSKTLLKSCIRHALDIEDAPCVEALLPLYVKAFKVKTDATILQAGKVLDKKTKSSFSALQKKFLAGEFWELSSVELQRVISVTSRTSGFTPLFGSRKTGELIGYALFDGLIYFNGKDWCPPPIEMLELQGEDSIDERTLVGKHPCTDTVVLRKGQAWAAAQQFGLNVRWERTTFSTGRSETAPVERLWLKAPQSAWAKKLMEMCREPLDHAWKVTGPFQDDAGPSTLFRSYFSWKEDKFLELGLVNTTLFSTPKAASDARLGSLRDSWLAARKKAPKTTSILEWLQTSKLVQATTFKTLADAEAAFYKAELALLQKGYALADIVAFPE